MHVYRWLQFGMPLRGHGGFGQRSHAEGFQWLTFSQRRRKGSLKIRTGPRLEAALRDPSHRALDEKVGSTPIYPTGVAVPQVGYLGRWKSSVILQYAEEALETMAANTPGSLVSLKRAQPTQARSRISSIRNQSQIRHRSHCQPIEGEHRETQEGREGFHQRF